MSIISFENGPNWTLKLIEIDTTEDNFWRRITLCHFDWNDIRTNLETQNEINDKRSVVINYQQLRRKKSAEASRQNIIAF